MSLAHDLGPVPDENSVGRIACRPRGEERRGAACRHCALPISVGEQAFCGAACRSAHELLVGAGLERPCQVRGADRPVSVRPPPPAVDRAWLARLARRVASAEVLRHVVLEVDGLHAPGCTWLVEELFRRQPGCLEIALHPALSRIELWVHAQFPIERFVDELEGLGHRVGPVEPARAAEAIVARLGACFALASGSMVLGAVRTAVPGRLLAGAAGGLAVLSLWLGGAGLFRRALSGLRRGEIAAELPAALGLGLLATSRPAMAGFLAAVCAGTRAVELRLAARHRSRLLRDGDDAGVVCRRVRGERVEQIECARIRPGDQLLIAPGELVPVDATVAGPDAAHLAAGDGSAPRPFTVGEPVVAGASNAGEMALRVVAARPFSLDSVLRAPAPAALEEHSPRQAGLGIAAAAGAGLAWIAVGHGERAVSVMAAVLLVSWPAGLALAIARDRIGAALRRDGVLLRRPDALARVGELRRVALDRLGAVSLAAPELRVPEALARLADRDRAALAHLALHSRHPRSRAVRRALDRLGALALIDGAGARLVAGRGVEAVLDGARYRLGAPRWVVERGSAPAACLGFSRDGRLLAWLAADEAVRPAAAVEIAALRRAGLEPHLLSGGDQDELDAMAARVGLPAERARGRLGPDDKAAWLAAGEPDALFLGNGVDDLAVAGRVTAALAHDRPLVAGAADLYLTRPGLASLVRLREHAEQLVAVAGRARSNATAASASGIALAAAGALGPGLVAILMPLAAVTIAALTVADVDAGQPGEDLAGPASAAARA